MDGSRNASDMSVPPGYVSLTSFTLKRTHKCEKVDDHGPVENDIATLKRSLRLRPWILPTGVSDVLQQTVAASHQFPNKELRTKPPLPKGVNLGCPTCGNSLKVHTTWRPEQSCSPDLQNVPVFYPTDQEFNDALNYIASIRLKSESYGMCRIVPPSSWKPPCLLQEKSIWESSKFTAHVQRINELQNICFKREPPLDAVKDSSNAESCRCEHGLEYTLKTFKRYAEDFQRQYFKIRKDYPSKCTRDEGPSAVNIEGEYWRVVQNPDSEIEVLSAADFQSKFLGSGFPVEAKSDNGANNEYVKSHWNLNNIPNLSGSLLSLDNHETSVPLVPQLFIGMCFSSHCWNVKEHHLYSLIYSHMGAPSMWYSIPSRYRFKFEEVAKKNFPELLQNPRLFHKLVPQLSPSTLIAEGIPVYCCLQQPREFVVVFPGVYHSGFSCGFNCSESIDFGLIDWLPYGQTAVELYSEQCRKTSISYDRVLLGAAMRVVKAQWKLLFKENTWDDYKWREVYGKDGNPAQALKECIKQESIRRKYLCNPSQSRKMEGNFDALAKRECCICLYDLHLSAAGCPCSPNKYTCLRHSKQICSCPWGTRYFLFRYEISELNMLLEALEGNMKAVYRWAEEKLGLTVPSSSQSEGNLGLAARSNIGSQLVEDPVVVPKIHSPALDSNPGDPVVVPKIHSPAPDSNPGKQDTAATDNSSDQNSRKRSNPNADDALRKSPHKHNQPIIVLSDSEDE